MPVDLSVGEDALVGRDVDDAADQVAARGVVGEQLALERHRQLVDQRGVDVRRARGVESRPGELVGNLVARYEPRVIAGRDLVGGGHADGEGPRREDVFRGFVPGGEAETDRLVGEHPAPRGIHDVGHPLLVVGRHDQHRHREEPAFRSEILSHVGLQLSP